MQTTYKLCTLYFYIFRFADFECAIKSFCAKFRSRRAAVLFLRSLSMSCSRTFFLRGCCFKFFSLLLQFGHCWTRSPELMTLDVCTDDLIISFVSFIGLRVAVPHSYVFLDAPAFQTIKFNASAALSTLVRVTCLVHAMLLFYNYVAFGTVNL